MPIVTQELIESGVSDNGGWSLAQLKTILPESEFSGLKNGEFPKSGWRQRLDNSRISQEKYEQFLKLKNKHLERKNRVAQQKASQLGFADLDNPYETDLYPGKEDISQDEEQMLSHLASIKQEIRPPA